MSDNIHPRAACLYVVGVRETAGVLGVFCFFFLKGCATQTKFGVFFYVFDDNVNRWIGMIGFQVQSQRRKTARYETGGMHRLVRITCRVVTKVIRSVFWAKSCFPSAAVKQSKERGELD